MLLLLYADCTSHPINPLIFHTSRHLPSVVSTRALAYLPRIMSHHASRTAVVYATLFYPFTLYDGYARRIPLGRFPRTVTLRLLDISHVVKSYPVFLTHINITHALALFLFHSLPLSFSFSLAIRARRCELYDLHFFTSRKSQRDLRDPPQQCLRCFTVTIFSDGFFLRLLVPRRIIPDWWHQKRENNH